MGRGGGKKHDKNRKYIKSIKNLRTNQSDAESLIWYLKGHKFRRQHPIKNYIVDFVCLERKLIIEIDGSQHFSQTYYDEKRTKILENLGFRVIRFLNTDVLLNTDSVIENNFAELGSTF